MSAATAGIVRQMVDTFNRTDLDGFLRLCHPAIEFVPAITALEGHLQGHEGARLWWQEMRSAFEPLEVEIDAVIERPAWYLATAVTRGRAVESDLPVEWDFVMAGELDGGQIRWWRSFRPPEQVFETLRKSA